MSLFGNANGGGVGYSGEESNHCEHELASEENPPQSAKKEKTKE